MQEEDRLQREKLEKQKNPYYYQVKVLRNCFLLNGGNAQSDTVVHGQQMTACALPVFVNKVLLQHRGAHNLHIVCGGFYFIMAQLVAAKETWPTNMLSIVQTNNIKKHYFRVPGGGQKNRPRF